MQKGRVTLDSDGPPPLIIIKNSRQVALCRLLESVQVIAITPDLRGLTIPVLAVRIENNSNGYDISICVQ